MYAVFETGGKQYKAAKGDVVHVEKLDVEPGKAVSFDALMISDGDNIMIGTPTVKGAKVKAKVVEHGKARKIIVFKFKPKKDYRKKQGHRQPFTKIEITGITTAKEKVAEEAAAEIAVAEKQATKPAAKATAAKPAEAKTAAKSTAAKTAKPAEAKETAEAKPKAKPAAKKETEKEA